MNFQNIAVTFLIFHTVFINSNVFKKCQNNVATITNKLKFKFHKLFLQQVFNKMFRLKIPKYNSCRYQSYSTTISKNRDVSAATIRKTFLDYFIAEHNHRFIRSSPVTPFCDPTVPFVNAGMNQVCSDLFRIQQNRLLFIDMENLIDHFVQFKSSKIFFSANRHHHANALPIHKNAFESVANTMI